MVDERRNEIVDELKELGNQLQALMRTAATSERSKELQQEITKGVQEITRQVEIATRQARESQTAKELGAQAQKVMQSPQMDRAVQEVRVGLLRGLQELNDQLRKVVVRAEEKAQAPAEPPVEPPSDPSI